LKAPAEKREETILPENLAELVVKKKPEPKPVEKKLPEKSTETKVDNARTTDTKQVPANVQQARDVAQTKGVLALKSDFADLMGDSSDSAKMGANAHVSSTGKAAAGDAPQRSVIGSQATGGSAGSIPLASVVRGRKRQWRKEYYRWRCKACPGRKCNWHRCGG